MKVGVATRILITDLTGETSVTFNGTAAKFTVASVIEITTTPTGATSGTAGVVTPAHGEEQCEIPGTSRTCFDHFLIGVLSNNPKG
jgi:hypothetical protein